MLISNFLCQNIEIKKNIVILGQGQVQDQVQAQGKEQGKVQVKFKGQGKFQGEGSGKGKVQSIGNFTYLQSFLGGSPFFLKSIFGGSPRISFAFSLTDSLTDSLIGSYLFQKGRVFHRSFGFLFLKCSLRTMEHFNAPYFYNLNKSQFK